MPTLPPVPGDPTAEQMVKTGEAASIIGVDQRTVERWVDLRKIRGGRAPVTGSHRWVDVRHAVAYAVAAGRAHLIPPRWQHLIAEVTAAAGNAA